MMVKWGWMIWKRDNNRETKDQSNSQIDKQNTTTQAACGRMDTTRHGNFCQEKEEAKE